MAPASESSLSLPIDKPPPAKLALTVEVDFEKQLPDVPPLLTPQRKVRRASPLMFLKKTVKKSRLTFTKQPDSTAPAGLRWHFIFPALIISFLVFVVATALLLFVTFGRSSIATALDPWAIHVSRLPQLGLMITTVSTHMVAISVPFLVSVMAYCVAGSWIDEQKSANTARRVTPTPLQYAYIVKLLTTASITSVFEAGRYINAAKNHIRIPRAFYLALRLTSTVLGLSFLLILADVWLHATVSVVSISLIPSSLAVDENRRTAFGIVFNESVCAFQGSACLDAGWASGEPWIVQKGLRVAANTSEDLAVVTINGTAVVIPSARFSDLQFPSFGLRAECNNLTPSCVSPNNRPTECSAAGDSIAGSSSSSRSARPSSTSASTVVTPTPLTQIVATSGLNSNPQKVVLQLNWSNSTLSPANPAVSKSSAGDVLAWASCDLTLYNITVEQTRGVFRVGDQPTSANPAFAGIMHGLLLSQVGNLQLLSSLQATMLSATDEPSAMNAMNQALGQLALSLFTGTLQLDPTLIRRNNPITQSLAPASSALLTRYPLTPLAVYLVLLYTYAFAAFAVFVYAARLRAPVVPRPGQRPANTIQLTQLRLTDPLAHIAALYPPPRQAPAPEDLRELFLESEDAARLEIGIQSAPKDHRSWLAGMVQQQQPVFGIYRRSGPWSSLEIA
ncbi:hypothetical protein MIND_01091600 [Mycena indigotica]|uniref:Uncharacterized protein n=1 Tax=Mycena indigotica TaxID=2126181 RepID=A0A8H6VXH8_9AGAR|nr:uncharacterized protein MIND_01091600 [Mycena indigotica]KAF7295516.1 hypothetical protein MIND_01091600 [Mycena indigotica]